MKIGTIYKNILNVSVNPSAAIEFQHFKGKIIEKINSFLVIRQSQICVFIKILQLLNQKLKS